MKTRYILRGIDVCKSILINPKKINEIKFIQLILEEELSKTKLRREAIILTRAKNGKGKV